MLFSFPIPNKINDTIRMIIIAIENVCIVFCCIFLFKLILIDLSDINKCRYKLFITFGDVCVGIKHYLARVNRPQTNGKVEIFFLTYKT